MKNKNPWDLVAQEYDKEFGNHGDWLHKHLIYPWSLKVVGDIKDKNVIDLGSGTGTFSRMLRTHTSNVTAIDSSEEMLKHAKKKEGNNHITYIKADILNLPIKGLKFDIAFMIMVLHTIKNYYQALEESFRILKKNGKLIIVLPHPAFIHNFRSIDKLDSSKYISTQKLSFTWKQYYKHCNAPTDLYNRSIENYFQSITNTGFNVKMIYEPPILDSAIKELTSIRTIEVFKRLKEIPSFIILECQK